MKVISTFIFALFPPVYFFQVTSRAFIPMSPLFYIEVAQTWSSSWFQYHSMLSRVPQNWTCCPQSESTNELQFIPFPTLPSAVLALFPTIKRLVRARHVHNTGRT